MPPTSVASTSQAGGSPFAARNIVGTVVTSRVSMIRGLVSATYPCRVAATGRGEGARARPGGGAGGGPAGGDKRRPGGVVRRGQNLLGSAGPPPLPGAPFGVHATPGP